MYRIANFPLGDLYQVIGRLAPNVKKKGLLGIPTALLVPGWTASVMRFYQGYRAVLLMTSTKR